MNPFNLTLARFNFSLLLGLVPFIGGSAGVRSDEQFASPVFHWVRDTIVVARVSTNPKKHYKHLKSAADYLAAKLREFGVEEGKVLLWRS